MKWTTISPRTTVVTKYTAIFSLIERILLIGVVSFPYVYYYLLKCPLEDANLNIIAAVAFSITIVFFASGYSLFRNQNLLLQVTFPKASEWKKVGLYFLMLLLFPIGEIYFLYNKIGKRTVYTYIQYPRILISPTDVKLSSVEAIDWWFANDYESYIPEVITIGIKGLTTIANLINKNSYYSSLVDSDHLTIQINTKNGMYIAHFSFEEFSLETFIDENITIDLPKEWIWSDEPKSVKYTKEFASEYDSDLKNIAEDIMVIIKNFELQRRN